MWRSGWRAVLGLIALTGLAGCGTLLGAPAAPPGHSDSIIVSLKVVPAIRFVTVNPNTATFGNCIGSTLSKYPKSGARSLSFPNGHCAVVVPGKSYPVTITNNGVAAYVDVSASPAVARGGGAQWSLCNLGTSPAVACTGSGGKQPGMNQYVLRNQGMGKKFNVGGLTSTPACDNEFGTGHCWVAHGISQSERVYLIGPSLSTNDRRSWTVTITWTPYPP
jgi:hypothetical protein